MDTTVWLVQFTLTLQALSDDMLVGTAFPVTSSQLIESLLDVLVHRQLAAAISYNSLHASLHSKTHVERTLDVVNKRHRMAQMAGRASVEFYVGLALKARAEKSGPSRVTEEAFVIRTFRNGLNVFVSKLVALFVFSSSRAERNI